MAKLRTIQAKTDTQKDMIITMAQHDITFAFGPAGCGKTFVSCGIAIEKLMFKDCPIDKIVIIRPNVEIGKGIGYYPGDKIEKTMNYIEPVINTMQYVAPDIDIKKLIMDKTIEIIPVSLTRGYTFNNAFVILDEAQSCSYAQLKCVLTRHGENTKTVINGDLSQIDIPKHEVVLDNIAYHLNRTLDCVGLIEFGPKDIVRSGAAQAIVKALEGFNPYESANFTS